MGYGARTGVFLGPVDARLHCVDKAHKNAPYLSIRCSLSLGGFHYNPYTQ